MKKCTSEETTTAEVEVMELTTEEVIQILNLFAASDFEELHLETATLKLVVSKGGGGGGQVRRPPAAEAEDKEGEWREEKVAEVSAEAGPSGVSRDGLVPIRAPMLGIFYRSPEPGAPPYVEVGTLVKEEDTVALIEVMKVFNAVKAGVRGYIEEVCAENGELVEFGQPLFLVRPAADS